MTYLIGDGSPTRVGMAVFPGCGAAVRSWSEYGQFRYTWAVYSFSFASSGTGTIDTAPLRVVPMYGYGRMRRAAALLAASRSFFASSSGVYFGFAFDWRPLPTPTR